MKPAEKKSGRFRYVDDSVHFQLESDHSPAGDQPKAIEALKKELNAGAPRLTLLGVTGSGKTFTMANVIADLNRPALVLAHNKTLAAQLYSEFSELFPKNAVHYFVSYYDYYQPEAYVASTDTYIEKDSSINEEIDKLRHGATRALFERRDVIIIASVSCIYGLGAPESYLNMTLHVEQDQEISRRELLKSLVELQYARNDYDFKTGTFRVRGDVVEICPASESEKSVRIELFGDEIEAIHEIDRLSGKVLNQLPYARIYPASHFVTGKDSIKRAMGTIETELESHLPTLDSQGKILERHRLEQRTRYDLELLNEMGFCPGIENYSRHITGRAPSQPPPTLMDYFPEDFLVFIDESHVTVSQLVGMYRGDRARKQNLVNYGFRLPSALDNRPLQFSEFEERSPQVIYVSATPGDFEKKDSQGRVIEQIIRPTGLLDPEIEIRPAKNQVDDFLEQVRARVEMGHRVLVTTLTKRMAEDLSEFYRRVGVRVKYLHSDIHTLDRIELIRGLREGEFDLLVGINLLREGLDLPEVSLVGVMDADKEGFLRSQTSLVQTIGRAARHIDGKVILYADKMTDSLTAAIEETERRKAIQQAYNEEHNITPVSVRRGAEAVFVEPEAVAEAFLGEEKELRMPKTAKECQKKIAELRTEMKALAKAHEFEKAAVVRDKVLTLEKCLLALWRYQHCD